MQNAFTILILFPQPCPYFPHFNYCNLMLMFDTRIQMKNMNIHQIVETEIGVSILLFSICLTYFIIYILKLYFNQAKKKKWLDRQNNNRKYWWFLKLDGFSYSIYSLPLCNFRSFLKVFFTKKIMKNMRKGKIWQFLKCMKIEIYFLVTIDMVM